MDNGIPPQNMEMERALLGGLLVDGDQVNKILDILTAEHFYDQRHGFIFTSILKLNSNNRPIDLLTVQEQLKKDGKLKQSGGSVYLSELVTEAPGSYNVLNYAETIKEKSIRRNIIKLGGKLTELANVDGNTVDEILNEVEKSVVELSGNTTTKDFFDSTQLLEMHMERADQYAKDPDSLRGINSGLRDFDKILGGLHKSDLLILAARPSVGKSAFAIHLARYAAVHERKSVAFFSLEMPAVQLMERMLAQQMEANLWNLRMYKLSESEYRKYAEASGKIGDSKIFINDVPGITMVQLRSKVRKLAVEHGLDMIVIDYLQLMQTREIDNRAQAIGEISRSLKILARELNIPILALSQLNRAVENRTDRIPQLSDLRESGSIEQDADIVIFLSKDVSGDEDVFNEEVKRVDVVVAKHRNGATGRFQLDFVGPQQRFVDVNK